MTHRSGFGRRERRPRRPAEPESMLLAPPPGQEPRDFLPHSARVTLLEVPVPPPLPWQTRRWWRRHLITIVAVILWIIYLAAMFWPRHWPAPDLPWTSGG